MQQALQVKRFWDSTTEQQQVELLTLDVDYLHRQAARLTGKLSKRIAKNFFLRKTCDITNTQDCHASLECNITQRMILLLHLA
jgi:hypothetical protein